MADPVSLAITIALQAASMAMTATRKIEGPRLKDLSATVADYGTPINYFYGTCKLECPAFFCEPIKEVKKKRKTKGGKYSDYTYFGTFGILVAGQPIDKYLRLWMDKHLVYDSVGAGVSSIFDLQDGTSIQQFMRLYYGTETQMPDPRMMATIEANEGAGMCPAYRGWSYSFFEDLPLEKLGNRFPQVSWEVATIVTPSYPSEIYPTTLLIANYSFSPDRSRMFLAYNSTYEIWDTAGRTRIVAGTLPYGNVSTSGIAISNAGQVYYAEAYTNNLIVLNPDGIGLAGTVDMGFAGGVVQCLADTNGVEYVLVAPVLPIALMFIYPINSPIMIGAASNPGFVPKRFFADSYGDIWVVGSAANGATGYMLKVVEKSGRSSPDSLTVAGINLGAPGEAGGLHVPSAKQYYLRHQNMFFTFDDATLVQKSTGAWTGGLVQDFNNIRPADSFWSFGGAGASRVSAVDGSLLQSVAYSSWGVGGAGSVYEPLTNALVGTDGAGNLIWYFLDRASGTGVSIQDIFEDVGQRCGVPLSDIEASQGVDIIPGYHWTQGAGDEIVSPLLDLYDYDVRPHNFVVQLLARTGISAGTLTAPYFVRESKEAPRYEISIVNDADLLRRMFLVFADKDNDHQPNSAMVQRPVESIDTTTEITVDMSTLSLDKATGQQQLERNFRRRHLAREMPKFKLSYMQLALEPGDCWDVDFDGELLTLRLKQAVIGKKIISTEWEREDSSLSALSGSAGAAMLGRPPSVILAPGLTQGFVLDIPYLADSAYQANPILYIAGGPYSATAFWPGGDVYVSDSNADIDFAGGFDAIPSTYPVSWGYTPSAIGSGVESVFNPDATVSVVVKNGTLDSVTLAELLADQSLNQAIIGNPTDGWEVVQFMTATLTATDTYDVTGFIRGARGTEAQIDSHADGDYFVLVGPEVIIHPMSVSEIGDTDSYKVATQGRSPSSSYPIAINFSAAANKPYAPAHLTALRDTGTGDWTFGWSRRARIGGALVDGRDVPLVESSESYKIEILSGSTVLRTIVAITNSATYTAAQQTTDFGAPQTSFDYQIKQVSPALGIDGFATAAIAA